jgi:lysophospholipase L1-like esterase
LELVEDTPGARLATGVARAADRRVHLKSVAVTGSMTSDLDAQITEVIPIEPQVAVILVGANDVTHTVRPAQSVRLLNDAVRRLRDAGVEVVVGTCPDLGTIEPLIPPLRQLARSWSRRLAAAQTIATVEAGGRTVSLGSILGPEFAQRPQHLFGPDRFHPSRLGYHRMAAALLPTVLVALGVAPEEEILATTGERDRLVSLSDAAVEAASHPGTEVESAQAGTGLRGRWVLIRRRRRGPDLEAEGPESEPVD